MIYAIIPNIGCQSVKYDLALLFSTDT